MANVDPSLDRIYDNLWQAGTLERWAAKQPDLQPRGPDDLLSLVTGIGLGPTTSILDVGCGQGVHACELAQRFGSCVVAVDPVESNLATARDRVRRHNLGDHVRVEPGRIEHLSFPSSSFALVWCRSVIVHLPALSPAFAECWRVLAPGGFLMLQTGYATPSLEPYEGALLRQRLGFLEPSMHRPDVEAAFTGVGFTTVRSEQYASEFAEFYEQADGRCGRYLAGIARFQRAEPELIEHFGREAYDAALGMYYWQVYQMLGKISYHAYLLKKTP